MAKSSEAYEALRARILSGQYGPGYRIVVDAIAAEFGVSAGPVREALRRLEGGGLISHARNVGATVAGVDEETFAETSEVMAMLEARATALAMPELTKDDFASLRALNDRMQAAAANGEMGRFSDLNRQFHEHIEARCPNLYLRELIGTSWDRLQIGYRLVFVRLPLRHQESIAEHEEIIRLFERQATAAEIEAAVAEHKLQTIEALRASRLEAPSVREPTR
jgi:DNA-binding GntR family transcriptional regulator